MTRISRIWHWYAHQRRWVQVAIGVALLVVIVGPFAGGSDDEPKADAASADTTAEKPTNTPKPENPTNTPKPPMSTPTAVPTATPTATPQPPPPPLSGRGQTAPTVELPGPAVWIATLTHTGRSNFIVRAYDPAGTATGLVNEIGNYSGARPIFINSAGGKYTFDINADGAWTIAFARPEPQLEALVEFSGQGDAVSGLFVPVPGPKVYAFTHDGKSNFIVRLQCDQGGAGVQNEIGPVSGTRVVNFASGAKTCMWDVRADGSWSIKAQ